MARRGRRGLLAASGLRTGRKALALPRALRVAARATAVSRSPRAAVETFRWSRNAVHDVREQLRTRRLPDVAVPSTPSSARDRIAAELGARAARASCLERSLTLQAWLAGHGDHRDVVIGVRDPAGDFAAHAWLEGERGGAPFTEITRRRSPAAT